MNSFGSNFLCCALITGILTTGFVSEVFGQQTQKPYNVLFITVDDMRDYVGYLNGYRGIVHTPNIDRLAKSGVAFTNAHTASTVCCPSRNAMMTGKRPSSTGLYDNSQWWKAALPDLVTMPQHFKNNGYHTAGAGKIFHHTPGNNPPCSWNEFQDQVFDDPWVFAKWSPERYFLNFGYRGEQTPFPDWKPLNGIKEIKNAAMDWGAIPGKSEADYGDVQIVNFARDFLSREHDKPFFLALGTYRPHIPWHVPQKYFDMYPLEDIVLPNINEDDLEDIPPMGKKLAHANTDYQTIGAADKLKEALQAYLASITFADAQLGAILDLLEASGHADNTIIVFWSDHGWHFGTKEHWHKQTLWEECTRIPFIITVPGMTRPEMRCHKPVDMVNVFPTLISLCDLPILTDLDGYDMTPLLQDPESDWAYPARSEIKTGNMAVRSQNWRYIRYRDGTEELYDRRKDPAEWNNLAGDASYTEIIQEHRKWIPEYADPLPGKVNYFFDPYSYTFMDRISGAFVDGKK
jgi:arylsulfatase A-like enzyme